MHLCSSFLAIPQLPSSCLYSLRTYLSSYRSLFLHSGAPSWDLFLFFCDVSSSCTRMIHFFCSHLPLPVILLVVPTSLQWLFWEAPGGLFQLLRSQWSHSEFHGIHFYPMAYPSLPLHQYSPIWSAIISFPQTFRISKLNSHLDVSFPTSMFFHRQISHILQGMLFSPISLLVHFHLLGFTSTGQKYPRRLSSCLRCASIWKQPCIWLREIKDPTSLFPALSPGVLSQRALAAGRRPRFTPRVNFTLHSPLLIQPGSDGMME